jgi:hypothetical protein
VTRQLTQVQSANIQTLLAQKKRAVLTLNFTPGFWRPVKTVTLLPDATLRFENALQAFDLGGQFGKGYSGPVDVTIIDFGDVLTSPPPSPGSYVAPGVTELVFTRTLPGGATETITVDVATNGQGDQGGGYGCTVLSVDGAVVNGAARGQVQIPLMGLTGISLTDWS